MKQGKTLRLTSIVLALMMMFALFSVLLVPVGTAGAAVEDENVYIDFDVAQTPDTVSSTNYLRRPKTGASNAYNVNITVTEDIWKDTRTFEDVLLTFERPDGSSPADLSGLVMSDIGSGKWRYTFQINSGRMTGLWAIKVYRKDGTWIDSVPFYTGIFWIYEEIKANGLQYSDDKWSWENLFYEVLTTPGQASRIATATSKFIPTSTSKDAFVTRGTQLDLWLTPRSDIDHIKYLGIDDKIIAEKSDYKAGVQENVKYTIPSDVAHLKEFEIKALAYTGARGAKKTELARFAANGTGIPITEDKYKIIVDAEGPKVGEMALFHNSLLGQLVKDNKMFAYDTYYDDFIDSIYDPALNASLDTYANYYRMEIKSITDAESGVAAGAGVNPVTSKVYARFTNLYNKNMVIGMDDTKQFLPAGPYTYYKDATSAYRTWFPLATTYWDLIGQSWKLEIVAYDNLGNESVTEYGRVDVHRNYDPIRSLRVEAQNVLEMYVGQTLTTKDILNQNVKVLSNVLGENKASYPDAFYWSVTAADSALLDYDPEKGTVTAKKSGEGRLMAYPYDIWKDEYLNWIPQSETGHYLAVRITDEPVVKSLSLNNTTMTIDEGQTQKLTATVDPAAVKVTWETSDASIATVDAEGNVKGIKAGTAVIYAKAGHLTKQCVVTVKGETAATGITLNKSSMTLSAPNSETLFATLTPAGATTAISWNTSDASVATVDNAGKVTAVKNGKATITATAGAYSAKCEVTVADVEGPTNDGWGEKDGNKVYYVQGKLILGWRRIDGYWYYFAPENGYMRGKGWLKEGSKWYYLNSDGKMKEGEWLKEGGKWYWLKISTGAMAQSEWYKVNGVWYLFDDNGRMLTGWQKVRGIWYYMKSSGAMYEGWLQDGGVWYYLTPTGGAMVTGRVVIGGRTSDFAASGRWLGYVK